MEQISKGEKSATYKKWLKYRAKKIRRLSWTQRKDESVSHKNKYMGHSI